jgi:hypothetical protein
VVFTAAVMFAVAPSRKGAGSQFKVGR